MLRVRMPRRWRGEKLRPTDRLLLFILAIGLSWFVGVVLFFAARQALRAVF